jgi:acetyltransferase
MNTGTIVEEAQNASHGQTDNDTAIPEGLCYPKVYAFTVDLPEVGPIKVRPFQQGDIDLFETLFRSLTPRSVYLRFFGFLKQLPPDLRDRLDRIDHDRQIALVALRTQDDQEIMLGDARVMITEDGQSGEFSVLVADQWQGKGIGACLLAHCLDIARSRHVDHIFGVVLAENVHMLALGRKLGFKATYCPGSREYELSKFFSGTCKNDG